MERDDEGSGEQACFCCSARRRWDRSRLRPRPRPRPIRSRNITAIIPFAAGNANDITARIVFEQLSASSSASRLSSRASRAPAAPSASARRRARTPDGYTILFHSATFSASYVTHKTLPYDTLNDFTPVAPVGIVTERARRLAAKGYKTAAELVAAAKAKPGALNFASAGIGAASHLAAEKFRIAAGIKAQHIPFKGPVEALTRADGRAHRLLLPAARGRDLPHQERQR